MSDPISIVIQVGGVTYRGILQPDAPLPPPTPVPTRKTFSVFTGASIPTNLRNVKMIADAIRGLCPWRIDDTNLEWWIKAGEGGSWEGEWDKHALALGSVDELLDRQAEAAAQGIRLVPWVVLRGRPEWEEGEYEMIRACAGAGGSVGLNLEPGDAYWNGPTSPSGVDEWLGRLGLAPDLLWLIAIPRGTAGDALGGPDTMRMWLSRVGGTSFECYDATSQDLAPNLAIPRIAPWIPNNSPWHQVCVVQRSRISAWANTSWASLALQCWTLTSD